jgi:hypothetical protein
VRDFLPVLFMIGMWGRKHRGGGKQTRFVDGETGTEVKAAAVDSVTGARWDVCDPPCQTRMEISVGRSKTR